MKRNEILQFQIDELLNHVQTKLLSPFLPFAYPYMLNSNTFLHVETWSKRVFAILVFMAMLLSKQNSANLTHIVV